MSTSRPSPERQYKAGTVDDDPRDLILFFGNGKKTGHALVCWKPSHERLPELDWRPDSEVPGGRRPLVAVLDTGVENHPWFPAASDGRSPFLLHAKDHGWSPPDLIIEPSGANLGTHRGHATFVAGLIRMAAPDAQVLSVKVMSNNGAVTETNVIAALRWLAGKVDSGDLRVDVVCMAFGRKEEPGDDAHAQQLKEAIAAFGEHRVTFVASAGNGGCDCPTLPARLAAEPGSRVVSVGADSATDHALYSNFGESWVKAWERGTDVLSVIPLTTAPRLDDDGYVIWRGTSFSAATHAGRLAQRVVEEAARPAPDSRPRV